MLTKLKDILVIDIETASGQENFSKIPADLQKHWNRKATFIRNEEDLSAEDLYFDRAAIYAEFGKVVVISVGFFHQTKDQQLGLRVTSFADHDEKNLLKKFKDFLESKFKENEITLCAHNGKEFDYPYLCRRMLVNDLAIPNALNLMGKKPWEVQHLDTMELWKFGDRKSFTSLDLLASIFGIPSSKTGIDGSQVNQLYYTEEKGLEKIAEYCRGDVVVTAQLYLRMNNLPLIPAENITTVT